MEHLQCLNPEELMTFIKITGMEYQVFSDRIILLGESLFSWVANPETFLFCLDQGKGV